MLSREDCRPKPDPEGIELFLTEWALSAKDVLFVGDYIHDIEAGSRAGVDTALFLSREGALLSGIESTYEFNCYREFFMKKLKLLQIS